MVIALVLIIFTFVDMNDQFQLARESLQLIKKDFLLEEEMNLAEDEPFDWLKQELTRIVSYLMNNDMNRLLNAMYRIDIPESEFKSIINKAPVEQVASRLADAIIAREKQKVILRRKYST
jgi:hypothetical protein